MLCWLLNVVFLFIQWMNILSDGGLDRLPGEPGPQHHVDVAAPCPLDHGHGILGQVLAVSVEERLQARHPFEVSP